MRPLWLVKIFKSAYRNRNIMFRMTRLPIIGRLIAKGLEEDALICLPKDNVIKVNESLDLPNQTVLPSQIVEYFIKKASHRWIMNFCICRTSNECKNYPREHGCLFLGEAVLKINPEFGKLVSVDEALEYVKICREEGFVHFIGRNKLDELWLGANPGEKLLTVCNCCPCCCISGGIKYMADEFRDKYSKMSGVEVKVDRNKCVGCGSCEKICIYDGIFVVKEKAVILEDKCMGCGRCVSQCPKKAISLTLNDKEFLEKSIQRISKYVDIE
ncbi:MAG: 4Fe-4S dicluster domain-containing protein [Candidatus Lokiarchaeota archaeon]|nr:4Fe-4S dicluster domain-containing protein [Candidatus Lokiarchaeota archaeon]